MLSVKGEIKCLFVVWRDHMGLRGHKIQNERRMQFLLNRHLIQMLYQLYHKLLQTVKKSINGFGITDNQTTIFIYFCRSFSDIFHVLVLFHVFIYFHQIFIVFQSSSFDVFFPLYGSRYKYEITSIILSLELPLTFWKVLILIKNIIKQYFRFIKTHIQFVAICNNQLFPLTLSKGLDVTSCHIKLCHVTLTSLAFEQQVEK